MLSKRTPRARSLQKSRAFGEHIPNHSAWGWWKNSEETAPGNFCLPTSSRIEHCLPAIHELQVSHLSELWGQRSAESCCAMSQQQAQRIPDSLSVVCLPFKKYSSFDNLLTSFLKEVMDDLARACEEGITLDSGTVYYAACIGFKLDMEWMVKVGSLTRSYQNVGHVTSHPCCHECDAGQAMVPFEDVNPSAAWMNTRFNTIPWTDQPPWDKIPFDDSKPAKFLRRDAFHIFRLGICRNFLGSSIYLLIYMGCFLILLGLHVLCFL